MKNILETDKDLKLFNEEGKLVYWFYKDSDGYSREKTFDSNGKELTYKNSNGFREYTYDSNGNELTYKNSDANGYERTFDKHFGHFVTLYR